MPLRIQSTLIDQEQHKSTKARTAAIEIVLADSAEADTASEILRIRTTVDLSADSYLPAFWVGVGIDPISLKSDTVNAILRGLGRA